MNALAQDSIMTKSNNDLYSYNPRDSFNEDEEIKSKDGLLVSESIYWELYYEDPDFKYEWNNGVLEEKPMSSSLGDLSALWLMKLLNYFLDYKPIARLVISEFAFKMKFNKKTVIRRPDFAIILKSNPCQMDNNDRSYKGTYDMCIEILSDSKKKYVKRDTKDKKNEYSNGKVKEYFIIDSKKKHTAFYKLVKKGNNRHYYEEIKPKNGIIQSKVLPGFQLREDDLYTLPDPKDLYKDVVYKPYVNVDFQKEIEKNEKERKAREEERKAKEKERKAKEKAINNLNLEKKANEKVLIELNKEKQAKENALKELERLKKELNII